MNKQFESSSYCLDKYSKEIKNFYASKPSLKKMNNPFVAMHSDYLNLEIKQNGSVWAKSKFNQGDILLEVRGTIVKLDQFTKMFRNVSNNKTIYDGRYGLLLWLNFKPGILLRPKGISLNLITSSLALYNQRKQKDSNIKGNCYIESHFKSKLLIKALEIIPKNEKIILEEASLKQFIYK